MSGPASPSERRAGAGGELPRNAEAILGAPLDADNPWPGLEAFREADEKFFYGREEEAAELLRLVRRDLLTVLYGLSGLGKSSLLRAGVFPALRAKEENGLPIYLRIDHDEASPHPVRQVIETIRREAEKKGVEAPSAEGVETLWEYFHRTDVVSWSRQHDVVTPVLVFDQFEELFTLGRTTAGRARRTFELIEQLRDLIEARTPASVKNRVDAFPEAAQAYSFGQHLFRVVFSLREEFVPDLDDLKEEIPSIANRMRLKHMTGDKALQVVIAPGGHLVTEQVAEEIVRFVAGGTRPTVAPRAGERQAPLNELLVEPALLSLFCRELNEERRARGVDRISIGLLREHQTSILEAYYEKCMVDRAPAVRIFVEDELVTASGYRDSAALDDALAKGVTMREIATLVDRRLLRLEERGSVDRVELTHDVLTKVVSASRDRRQQREALEKARREAARRLRQLTGVSAVALLFLVLLGILFVQWTNVKRTLALTHYRDGVDQLEEGRTRSGAASLARALRVYPQSSILSRALGLQLNSMFIRTAALTSLIYTEWPVAILTHADDVASAVFSPDGTRAVTASADRTARLWDTQTGVLIGGPLQHEEVVYAAAFSPDGTRVVTASADGAARLWDARTGASIGEPLQHSERRAVRSATFSPDGSRVVTASEDGTAQLWDAGSGARIGEPLKHDGAVHSAAFNHDGMRLVTASADGTAHLWDALTGAPFGEPLRHDDRRAVWSAVFSPDGSRVVTASEDRTARLWDARTGAAIIAPLRHDGSVWSATFSPDGTRVVTASEDRAARVWDVHTGALVEDLPHEAGVRSAVFSPDGALILTASEDHTARLWGAANGLLMGSPLRHEDKVWSAVFSESGARVLTASADATARLWDARTGAAVGAPLRYDEVVHSATFSPDGTRVVTAAEDHTARLWDARTGTPVGEPLGHDDIVYSAAFSPDGAFVITASADGTARVWDARTGAPSGNALRHERGGIWSATFNADGTRIVTASEDHTARLWDARSRVPIGDPLPHDGIVTSAAFNPDGTRVVTASGNTARFWDVRTGAENPDAALPHDVRVWSAAFSPDGTRVVTASADSTARVWEVGTGKQVGEPLRHGDAVRSAVFSPDGELVASASADGTARLWDARTGAPIGEPLRQGGAVESVAMSPDGTRIVTTSADRTTRLWDVSADAAISADELASFAETVAGRRLDDTGTSTEIVERGNRLATFRALAAEIRPGQPLTLPGLVHWFYADRATRPISPRASMTGTQ